MQPIITKSGEIVTHYEAALLLDNAYLKFGTSEGVRILKQYGWQEIGDTKPQNNRVFLPGPANPPREPTLHAGHAPTARPPHYFEGLGLGEDARAAAGARSTKGYYAKNFVNHEKKIIVIASAGTQFEFGHEDMVANGISDLAIAARITPAALRESKKNYDQVRELRDRLYEGYEIIHMGHSLGGFHASYNGVKNNEIGIGFDAPGIGEFLTDAERQQPNKNIYFYLAGDDNIVNTANQKIGRVNRYVLDDSDIDESDRGGYISTHGMENVFKAINPETGNFRTLIPVESPMESNTIEYFVGRALFNHDLGEYENATAAPRVINHYIGDVLPIPPAPQSSDYTFHGEILDRYKAKHAQLEVVAKQAIKNGKRPAKNQQPPLDSPHIREHPVEPVPAKADMPNTEAKPNNEYGNRNTGQGRYTYDAGSSSSRPRGVSTPPQDEAWMQADVAEVVLAPYEHAGVNAGNTYGLPYQGQNNTVPKAPTYNGKGKAPAKTGGGGGGNTSQQPPANTRHNPSLHDDEGGPIYALVSRDGVDQDFRGTIDIDLDGLHGSKPVGNYDVGATITPGAVFGIIGGGIQAIRNREKKTPEQKTLAKVNKSFKKYMSSGAGSRSNNAEKVLNKINESRRALRSDPEATRKLDAIEWGVRSGHPNATKVIDKKQGVPHNVAKLETAFQTRFKGYARDMAEAIRSLDSEKAAAVDKTYKGIPAHLKEPYSPFFDLLKDPSKLNEKTLRTMHSQAMRDGNREFFESVFKDMASKNPELKQLADAVIGKKPEPPAQPEIFRADGSDVLSIRGTPSTDAEAIEALAQDRQRQERARETNAWQFAAFRGVAYFSAFFVSDENTRENIDNASYFAQSMASIYNNFNNPWSVASGVIRILDVSAKYGWVPGHEVIKDAAYCVSGFKIGVSFVKDSLVVTAHIADARNKSTLPNFSDPNLIDASTGVVAIVGPHVIRAVMSEHHDRHDGKIRRTNYGTYLINSTTSFLYRNAELVCRVPSDAYFVMTHLDVYLGAGKAKAVVQVAAGAAATEAAAGAAAAEAAAGAATTEAGAGAAAAGISAEAALAGGAVLVVAYGGYCVYNRNSSTGYLNEKADKDLSNAYTHASLGNLELTEKCLFKTFKNTSDTGVKEEGFYVALSSQVFSERLYEEALKFSSKKDSLWAKCYLCASNIHHGAETVAFRCADSILEQVKPELAKLTNPETDKDKRENARLTQIAMTAQSLKVNAVIAFSERATSERPGILKFIFGDQQIAGVNSLLFPGFFGFNVSSRGFGPSQMSVIAGSANRDYQAGRLYTILAEEKRRRLLCIKDPPVISATIGGKKLTMVIGGLLDLNIDKKQKNR